MPRGIFPLRVGTQQYWIGEGGAEHRGSLVVPAAVPEPVPSITPSGHGPIAHANVAVSLAPAVPTDSRQRATAAVRRGVGRGSNAEWTWTPGGAAGR